MSLLIEALERIVNCIKRNRPEVVFSLMPGMSYAQIEEITKHLPIQFPQEILELYQWSNGTSKEIDYQPNSQYNRYIFDGYALLPLQEAIQIYLEKNNHCEYYYNYQIYDYNPKWIQLFYGYIGGELVGYIVINSEKKSCEVILKYSKDNQIIRQYTSLTSMMQTLAEFYEMGYWNSLHNKNFDEIWQKYNSSLVDVVVEKLRNDISYESLLEIAQDLSNFKDKKTVEPLIRILQKPAINPKDFSRQEIAAKILGEIGDSRALEPLISALQSEYWLTRHWAAVSLGMLKDKRAVEGLTNTLQDEYEEVRQMAMWALEQLEE